MRDISLAGRKIFQGEYARIQALLWMRVESKTLSVGRLLDERPTFPLKIREAVFNEVWQAVWLEDQKNTIKIIGEGEFRALKTLFADLPEITQRFPLVAPLYIQFVIRVLNFAWSEAKRILEGLFDKEITVRLASRCEDSRSSSARESKKQKPVILDLKESEKKFLIDYVQKQVRKRFTGDLWIYQEEAINQLLGKIFRAIRRGSKIEKLPNYINHAITCEKADTIKEKCDALTHRVYDNMSHRQAFCREMKPSFSLPDTNDDEKEKEAIKKFEARKLRLSQLMAEGLSENEALLEIEIETRSDCFKEGRPIPDERYEGISSFDENAAPIYKDGWLQSIEERKTREFLNQGSLPLLEDVYDSHNKEARLFLLNWIHSRSGDQPEERYARAAFLKALQSKRWAEINRHCMGGPAFIKKWGPIMQRLREGWTFEEIKKFWRLPSNSARMNQNDVAEAERFITEYIGVWANITDYDREIWAKYKRLTDKLWCPVGKKTKTIKAAEWPTKKSFQQGCLRWFTGKLWRKNTKSVKHHEIEDGGGPTFETSKIGAVCGRPRISCPLCKNKEIKDPKENVAEYLKRGGSVLEHPFAPIIKPVIDTGIYQRHLDLLKIRLLI
jgi:hypothetical protein